MFHRFDLKMNDAHCSLILNPLPDLMTPPLDVIEIDSGEAPSRSVIWLHGLGADGNDFAGIAPELGGYVREPVRFIFPHAPMRPVTINQGAEMRAWFDIVSLDSEARYNEQEIQLAIDGINELIALELERGVKPNHIVIAGFSQGGALALLTALTHQPKLAGVLALSTYLTKEAQDIYLKAPSRIPIFQAHGLQDEVITYDLGKETRRALQFKSLEMQWESYDMGHSVCQEQIEDIGQWLQTRLT